MGADFQYRRFGLVHVPKLFSVQSGQHQPALEIIVASFELAHAAQVAATIETAGQIVVRVLAHAQLDPGTHVYTWDGRDDAGRVVYGGRYQVHVSATNDLGRVDLRSPFTALR